jgi:2-iminobutanoate/2-iminopropanoate deaminase
MKSPVQVPDAPTPVGPYVQAQAVRLHGGNKLVFTAGQIAIDPKSGKLAGEGIADQTAQVLKNLSAVLAGAGLTLADVVKTTVYLADMQDFKAMNQVYEQHFTSSPPARTTIAAGGLPLGARVEIDAIAVGRDL